MTADAPKPDRALLAQFELPAPGLLRMVLTDSAKGVVDILEVNPSADGAYAGFLGAVEAASVSLPLQISCDFDHVEGRATARKTRIKAVLASACPVNSAEAS